MFPRGSLHKHDCGTTTSGSSVYEEALLSVRGCDLFNAAFVQGNISQTRLRQGCRTTVEMRNWCRVPSRYVNNMSSSQTGYCRVKTTLRNNGNQVSQTLIPPARCPTPTPLRKTSMYIIHNII